MLDRERDSKKRQTEREQETPERERAGDADGSVSVSVSPRLCLCLPKRDAGEYARFTRLAQCETETEVAKDEQASTHSLRD